MSGKPLPCALLLPPPQREGLRDLGGQPRHPRWNLGLRRYGHLDVLKTSNKENPWVNRYRKVVCDKSQLCKLMYIKYTSRTVWKITSRRS